MTRLNEIAARYSEELAVMHEDVRFLLATARAGAALAQELEEAAPESVAGGFRRGAVARYWASVEAAAKGKGGAHASSPSRG